MKITKISMGNPIKAKQAIKTSIAAFSTTAASLYAASKADGVDTESAINDYYRNEFELRNKSIGIQRISRFSPEEKIDILNHAEEIELYPEAFYNIINAQASKSPRFNGYESLMLFEELGQTIEKNPGLFKTILAQKDKDNNPRFNANECAELMRETELIKTYPRAFKKILELGFDASSSREMMLRSANILDNDTDLLNNALKNIPQETDKKKYIINLSKEIKHLNEIKIKERAEKEAKIQAEYEERKRQQLIEREEREKKDAKEWLELKAIRKAESKRIKQEKLEKAKQAAKERAELRSIKQAEAEKIKQEKMDFLNKKVGWVSAEKIFEKVNNAVNNNSTLTLETGEIIPDEVRNKIATHINERPKKAELIINARYKNLQPIFNEKDCLSILSELDKYYYVEKIKYLKMLDENNHPFFNAEQCKEMLTYNYDNRDYYMDDIVATQEKSNRAFSPEEFLEIYRNNNIFHYHLKINNKWTYLHDFLGELTENGEYKYTVKEALEALKELYENNTNTTK